MFYFLHGRLGIFYQYKLFFNLYDYRSLFIYIFLLGLTIYNCLLAYYIICIIVIVQNSSKLLLFRVKVSVHSLLLKNKLDYPKGVSVSAFLNFIKGVRYVLDY